MSTLIKQLRQVIVTDTIDLTACDEAYRDESGAPLTIKVRLNWTRAMKKGQRELQRATVELQEQYAAIKDLAQGDDDAAWKAALTAADDASDEHWSDWVAWWAQVFPELDAEEVAALASALPDQHWVWLTARAAIRAADYERGEVKKVGASRSRSGEGQDTSSPTSTETPS